MKALSAGIILIVLGVLGWYLWPVSQNGEPVACTADAKLCPDGSYVGRVAPNCAFAVCPGAATSTGGGEGVAPYTSGIRGAVMLGPTCPVMQNPPSAACADKPYETLVVMYRASDPVHAVSITRSDKNGTFEVSLPPGKYTIGAGESNLPRCAVTPVTVPPGGYADTTISCDTGIR